MISRLLALFALSIIAFGLGRVAPGDPAEILLRAGGDTPTAEAIATQRAELGLDDPVVVQYGRWLTRLACCLDGGRSFQTARPIRSELVTRAGNTILLAVTVATMSLVLVLALAVAGAWGDGRLVDSFARPAAAVSASVPSFVMGLVLIDLFAVRWHVFPSSGAGSLRNIALPALTLCIASWALPYRLLRSELERARRREFIAAVRARGLPHRHVMLRHALPIAVRPNLHTFGAVLAQLFAGSVVIERVFSWPGLGLWAIDAVGRRDYPVLSTYVMVIGSLYILINLLTDLLHGWLDPRPRHA
jgi:ABC-type dipeptide/oligopeptide/nickel transport system permease component